jgi:flavin reductase (DIM6/NTAB) family NADH-FMN oxidoreductase RutF
MNGFDSRELRRTLGAFTTGVTVVTTVDATGRRHGVTANSFSSVSLDPPLILWSQSLNSRSYPAFRDGERFVVNILAHDQAHVSNQFAKAAEDKFTGIATSEGIGGMPIIEGSAAHLECVKVATWPGGDHVVFLGRVEKIHRAPRKALAYGEGCYMVTFPQETGGAVASENHCGLQRRSGAEH